MNLNDFDTDMENRIGKFLIVRFVVCVVIGALIVFSIFGAMAYWG